MLAAAAIALLPRIAANVAHRHPRWATLCAPLVERGAVLYVVAILLGFGSIAAGLLLIHAGERLVDRRGGPGDCAEDLPAADGGRASCSGTLLVIGGVALVGVALARW